MACQVVQRNSLLIILKAKANNIWLTFLTVGMLTGRIERKVDAKNHP